MYGNDKNIDGEAVTEAALFPRDILGSTAVQFIERETTPDVLLSVDGDGNPIPVPNQQNTARFSITNSDPQHCRLDPQWWLIEMFAYSMQTLADGALDRQEVVAWNTLTNIGFRSAMSAKLVIAIGGDEIKLDAGFGMRYSIFSPRISLYLEVPSPAVALGSGGAQAGQTGVRNAVNGDLLGNVAVEARIRSNIGSLGGRFGQLTQTIVAPGGGPNVIAVPNRAKRVQFYQNDAGPAPAPIMRWLVGGPTGTFFDRGRIDFPAGSFHTDLLSIPGNAQFVDLGATARTITAVWDLEL